MPETVTISREDAEWLAQYGLWQLIRNLSAAPALADHLATAECVKARLEAALSSPKEPARIAANQWQRVTDTEPGDFETVPCQFPGESRSVCAFRENGRWLEHTAAGVEPVAPVAFFRVPPCPDELKGEQ